MYSQAMRFSNTFIFARIRNIIVSARIFFAAFMFLGLVSLFGPSTNNPAVARPPTSARTEALAPWAARLERVAFGRTARNSKPRNVAEFLNSLTPPEPTEEGTEQTKDEPDRTKSAESADERPAASKSATEVPKQVPKQAPKQTFSPQMLRLRDKTRTCLRYYYQRTQSVNSRSPWGIMHALIGYGVDAEVTAGSQRVNAIGWLCWNRPCRGMTLLSADESGIQTKQGPGYQGHEGQFLSMLALSRVKLDYPMRVDGHELTVGDLLEYEKRTCRSNPELTFKLIGIAHYEKSDVTWTNKWGETWSIPQLVREELSQPINGVACGGVHRLIGLSVAIKKRQKEGRPLDGEWSRAAKFIDAYHKYAMKLQNRDGSFSTAWLKRRENSGNADRQVQTTGHILEWLVFSLPQQDLTDRRIVRAVDFLATLMLKNRTHTWEVGPQGHALRALALYNERVFGDKPGQREALLARRPGK